MRDLGFGIWSFETRGGRLMCAFGVHPNFCFRFCDDGSQNQRLDQSSKASKALKPLHTTLRKTDVSAS